MEKQGVSHLRSRRSDRRERLIGWLAWASVALAAGSWALLGFGTDRWWVATAASFGPRWVLAVPIVGALGLAIRHHRRAVSLVVLAVAIIVGPVLGFEPGGLVRASPDDAWPNIRVVTVNGGGHRLNHARLVEFVDQRRPDVVAVQECQRRGQFPALWPEGWAVHTSAGLCLASRFAITRTEQLAPTELGGDGSAARYDLATPWGPVFLFSLHLETPRRGLEALVRSPRRGPGPLEQLITLRERESAVASRWARRASSPAIVLGDFNLSVDSAIYQRHWAGWRNAFAEAGVGFGNTKRTRWYGLRIDHILPDDAWAVEACHLGSPVGSDHLPLVADLRLRSAGRAR